MNLPKFFISCDWGTSNFRLRLVNTDDCSVLIEHRTDQGVKTLHEQFLGQSKLTQTEYFLAYLKSQVKKIKKGNKNTLIVVSGMASSNIGLMELPYGNMPFDQQGLGINYKILPESGDTILLISGIKNSTGMMRGEETQAIGLSKYLASYKKGTLILPGTHSKHIYFEDGCFTALKSFMTGELFGLLSSKSILANNVEPCPWIDKRKNAFLEGVGIGINEGLSENLFSIRAKQLMEDVHKEDGYYMLSGILIGDELSYLKEYGGSVFLATPQPFFEMYSLALANLLDKEQIICFADTILENALIEGQLKIIRFYENQ